MSSRFFINLILIYLIYLLVDPNNNNITDGIFGITWFKVKLIILVFIVNSSIINKPEDNIELTSKDQLDFNYKI